MATIFCSSCLLSKKCLFHGFLATFAKPTLDTLADAGFKIVDVCPEMLGGLPCPRAPARRREGRLWYGKRDVTPEFESGADKALKILKKASPIVVLLLLNSPACDPATGIFGKQAAALFPTIACHRTNKWRRELFDLLKLPPHQFKLFQ